MDRTPPPTARAALMRAAGDLLGSETLAGELGVSPRSCYQFMAGDRPVKDGVLRDTRDALIRRRQLIGAAIGAIREELA